MIKKGADLIQRVGYGDTMVRAVWHGTDLVHPNGRSYIFYADFYPYRVNNELTQYATLPLSETGYRACVPKTTYLQKSYTHSDDSLGVTIYDGGHQFTIQSWIVGTWLVDVLFESRNQTTNFIQGQYIYGGHCRIGKGTAGADEYVRDSTVVVYGAYKEPTKYTRIQFTVTKTVYDEAWYILPFSCQDVASAPVILDIYRLTAGIRKIA